MIALPTSVKSIIRLFVKPLLPHFADDPHAGWSPAAEEEDLSPTAKRYAERWRRKREENAKKTRAALSSIQEYASSPEAEAFVEGQGRLKDVAMLYKTGFSDDDSSVSSKSADNPPKKTPEDDEEEEVPATQLNPPRKTPEDDEEEEVPATQIAPLAPPQLTVAATPANPTTAVRCSSKHCSRPGDSFPLLPCAYAGCLQLVHQPCYLLLLTKGKSTEYTPAEGGVVLCTIEHHKRYLKDLSNSGGYKWENDGANGKSDPHHSHYYLLQWLEDPFNYAKWKGPPGQHTKLSLAGVIGDLIHANGTKKKWNPTQVQSRIILIEKKMRSALGLKDGTKTGAGITDKDRALGITTLEAKASYV